VAACTSDKGITVVSRQLAGHDRHVSADDDLVLESAADRNRHAFPECPSFWLPSERRQGRCLRSLVDAVWRKYERDESEKTSLAASTSGAYCFAYVPSEALQVAI
jgi:hypothetical protein